MADEIKNLRKEIDDVDSAIIALLEERMEIARNIAKYKAEYNIEALDQERWDEMKKHFEESAKEYGIPPKLVLSVFEAIHAGSLEEQEKILKKLHKDVSSQKAKSL